jgi:hypothetical protein
MEQPLSYVLPLVPNDSIACCELPFHNAGIFYIVGSSVALAAASGAAAPAARSSADDGSTAAPSLWDNPVGGGVEGWRVGRGSLRGQGVCMWSSMTGYD